jgi:hypothetical protein
MIKDNGRWSVTAIEKHPYLPREIYHNDEDYLSAMKRINGKRTQHDLIYNKKLRKDEKDQYSVCK